MAEKFGVTEKGFVPKLLADILQTIKEKLKQRFGEEWELDLYTPEGALILVLADEIATAWQGAKEAYFSKYLDTSSGIQLDYHGKSESPAIFRSAGSYATTTLEFTTNASVTIPKYTVVKKRGTNLTYMTVQSLVIGEEKKGQVQAIASEYGPDYNAIIGDISELGNNITGVVSVTNITPASGGLGQEKDIVYRERIRRNRVNRGGSTVNAITAELLKLETVNNALTLENIGEEIDENGVAPGFVRVYIDGIASKEVAETIHQFKAAGIETEGDQIYQVQNNAGQEKPIKFYLMEKKQFYVKIEIRNITDLELKTEALKQEIKNKVKEYMESIQQSGTLELNTRRVVTNQLEARAYSASNAILELVATIGFSSNPTDTENKDIPVGEYWFCEDETIEVV